MKKLSVPDMHCEMCVKRITNALTENGLAFKISLADKTVSIVDDDNVEQAVQTLDELGFTATVL